MTAIRQLAADLPSTGSGRRISPGFSGRWTSFLRLLVVTTIAASAVAGSGVATAADPPVTTSPGAAPRFARANPLASARLYVDPDGDARKGADARRRTDPAGARVLDQVAQQAQAQWLGNWIPTRTVARSVDQLTSRAAVQGQVPVIVTYAIPNRDCGGYSANGFSGNEEYLSWARELVRGLAGRPAVLIVEPDVLAQLDCLSPAAASDRLNLLRAATDVYAAAPGAVVYLDAGHAEWQRPDVMARRLQAAGVERVQGF